MMYLNKNNTAITVTREDNTITLEISDRKLEKYVSVDLSIVETFNLSKILFNATGSEHSELLTKEKLKIAKQAFADWLNAECEKCCHKPIEILLKNKFVNSDFYQYYLAIENLSVTAVTLGAIRIALTPYLPTDYFISDALIKCNILHFFNKPFHVFTRDFIAELEKEKVQFLNNQKG